MREAERPPALDDPDGVVPAHTERSCRRRIELRKLLSEERPNERLVDRDVGIPFRHRANLSVAPCLCEAPRVHWQLATLAVILLGFAAISGRIEGMWITAPMVFTAAGLLVGVEALGLVDPSATGVEVKTLAEATLAVVLFSDASRIDLKALRRTLGIPARLLGVGFPLTILAGFVAGVALLAISRGPRRSCSRSSSRRPTRRSARRSSRCRAFRCASARASTSRAG